MERAGSIVIGKLQRELIDVNQEKEDLEQKYLKLVEIIERMGVPESVARYFQALDNEAF